MWSSKSLTGALVAVWTFECLCSVLQWISVRPDWIHYTGLAVIQNLNEWICKLHFEKRQSFHWIAVVSVEDTEVISLWYFLHGVLDYVWLCLGVFVVFCSYYAPSNNQTVLSESVRNQFIISTLVHSMKGPKASASCGHWLHTMCMSIALTFQAVKCISWA